MRVRVLEKVIRDSLRERPCQVLSPPVQNVVPMNPILFAVYSCNPLARILEKAIMDGSLRVTSLVDLVRC